MQRNGIYGAVVTGKNLDYEGSITIDPVIMEEVGIVEFEKVLVANKRNGARFETYVISGQEGTVELPHPQEASKISEEILWGFLGPFL